MVYNLENSTDVFISIITSSSFSSATSLFILTTVNYQDMLSGRKFWNKLKFQENCIFITRSYLPWAMCVSHQQQTQSHLTWQDNAVWISVSKPWDAVGPLPLIHWTAKNSIPRCSTMQHPPGLKKITRGINMSSFLITVIRSKGVDWHPVEVNRCYGKNWNN